jgi:hypothetical protein
MRLDIEKLKRGDLIVFTGCSEEQRRFSESDDPVGVLDVGRTYEVDKVNVSSWYTNIMLTGIVGWFNSVCFRYADDDKFIEDLLIDDQANVWQELNDREGAFQIRKGSVVSNCCNDLVVMAISATLEDDMPVNRFHCIKCGQPTSLIPVFEDNHDQEIKA